MQIEKYQNVLLHPYVIDIIVQYFLYKNRNAKIIILLNTMFQLRNIQFLFDMKYKEKSLDIYYITFMLLVTQLLYTHFLCLFVCIIMENVIFVHLRQTYVWYCTDITFQYFLYVIAIEYFKRGNLIFLGCYLRHIFLKIYICFTTYE